MRSSRIRVTDVEPQLGGFLRLPAEPRASPLPSVVHGPGWLGVAGTKSYRAYHEALTMAGFAVVSFDYRGFGDSEGDPTDIDPRDQVEDWRRILRWTRERPDLDAARIGLFGSGATGGGNAFMVAAAEPEVRAVVAQVPIADGLDWLRRMRDADAWRSFLLRIDSDRRRRANGEASELVAARTDVTPTPKDRAGWKQDVDDPHLIRLAVADALFAYRPLDVASRVGGAMVVAVEGDDVTPTDHARRLYEAAQPPKRFVLQRGTTHYRAYTDHRDAVVPMIVDWFRRLLLGDPQLPPETEVVLVGRPT